jgi:cytochrome P450
MLYLMAKNPSTMRKLQQEIDDMSAKGLISDPVTYQQSCKMPYLQAVMKEAMRIHPATGLTLARVVPKGGAVLAGRKFKAGVSYRILQLLIIDNRRHQQLGRTSKRRCLWC